MELKKIPEAARRLLEDAKTVLSRVPTRMITAALGAIIVLAALLLFYLRPPTSMEEAPEAVTFFQIGTGSAGDEYFAVGERLAAAIGRPPGTPRCERGMPCGVAGLLAVARSSAGPVANVRAVSAGLFDSALVAAPILELAARGETPFKGEKPVTNLRAIAGVYREALYLVASRNANIGSVADLENMRVSVGPPGSGTREAALPVLAVHSLGRRTVQISEYDTETAIDLTLRGQLDAFFLVDALPSTEIASLADRGSINIVPVDGEEVRQLTRPGESFQPLLIPADLYRFVPETQTLGVSMVWIVNEEADPDLIHDITEALFSPNNRPLLSSPVLPGLLPGEEGERAKFATSSIPVPLHEGAKRYYREQGLTVEEEP
ncbi:TRAP transporter solute receptor, TAXI family [Parvibaculum lavamentivorans DS-1]|uniref:TRAP transporter solute receptor, TAXI family n=1 Tax=Parvibaculum lavamentivorans (strain DS-1 / DSM 13023 / NCIMB 13966) TaxID=402881 RepID=A7HPN0_PARL1|nr:TAXI family TRAP transporter solute-binding subunit [Parvibaculum lavamentivorans]ABS61863.1 TRAP transporter solute receptor, TAXI family [Parvibaculum lavamentivorans DS-1]